MSQLARWHHAEWGALYDDWPLPVAEAELAEHAQRRTLPLTLVALVRDALAGSVSLVEVDAPQLSEHGSPWLASLFVHPAFRRAGIGRRLVDAAVQRAAQEAVPVLHLFTPSSEGFYEALGWSRGVRETLNGVTVTLMRLVPAQRRAP